MLEHNTLDRAESSENAELQNSMTIFQNFCQVMVINWNQ